ncbi:hypothetical protein [Gilvibacter sediminis]|uniref:hypothetical protein n=1 Tax=Gilvibacter sediminis TaxID=379071 RepID=UPI0023502C1C|nr:hypothetical protein [Gilvibacter sediminis]MDC7998219.1 hypothetical protein [Gilvibacter sediminis]
MKRTITLLLFLSIITATRASDNRELLKSQYVSFVYEQIHFDVYLDGSFSFTLPSNMQYNYRGQRAKTGKGAQADRMSIHHSNLGANSGDHLLLDHSGIIYAIGDLKLEYNKEGQLLHLGAINLEYDQGRLSSLGGLAIFYDAEGLYSHTRGSVTWLGTASDSDAVRSTLNPLDQNARSRNRNIRFTGFGIVD